MKKDRKRSIWCQDGGFSGGKIQRKQCKFVIIQIISLRDGRAEIIDPYTGFNKRIEGDVFKLTGVEGVSDVIEYIENERKKLSRRRW